MALARVDLFAFPLAVVSSGPGLRVARVDVDVVVYPVGSGPEVVAHPARVDVDVVVRGTRSSADTPVVVYPDPSDAPGYRVDAVDMDGNLIETLTNANVDTVTWEKNTEEVVVFSSPKGDPLTGSATILSSEVQVYRNDRLLAWGPITSDDMSTSDGGVGFGARGVWWYFRRRFFGSAGRRELIANGDFESGFSGWSKHGGPAVIFDASNPDLPAPFTGTKAAASFGDVGVNHYLATRFPFSYAWPVGQIVYVSGWVNLVDYAGPAAFGFGLYLGWIVGGRLVRQTWASIDDDTPRGEWTPISKAIRLPPVKGPTNGVLEVRLYWPGGVVAWDRVGAVLNDTAAPPWAGEDQTNFASRIVKYAQTGLGKSPLNVGTNTPPTGVRIGPREQRTASFQFFNHEWIADAIEKLGSAPDGFDWSIKLTPKTRTFTTHFPRRGTDRRGSLTLKLGRPEDGGNLADARRGRDGISVATSIVTRGTAAGADVTREEGLAVDTSGTGGLVLEDVVNAPDDLPVGLLDTFAGQELASRKRVIPVLEVTTHEGAGSLIDLPLEPGDLVDVSIDDGVFTVEGDYEIVKIVLHAATDTLDLTLNLWED